MADRRRAPCAGQPVFGLPASPPHHTLAPLQLPQPRVQTASSWSPGMGPSRHKEWGRRAGPLVWPVALGFPGGLSETKARAASSQPPHPRASTTVSLRELVPGGLGD